MPLDGALWGKYAGIFREHVEGKVPDVLVPVLGGASVPFVFSSSSQRPEATEAGLIAVTVVKGHVAVRLVLGTRYTYDSWVWQVAMVDYDRAAGTDWPHYFELVGQARAPGEVSSA